MSPVGPRPPWRESLRLAALVLFATLAITVPVTAIERRDYRAPRVVLLGSGNGLSILVTAGDARLLIASGNDPVAFGNALGRVQPWTNRRIDVVLASSATGQSGVPASLVGDPHVRALWVLGPIAARGEGDLLAAVPTLPSPRMIALDDGITVLVETASPSSNGADAPLPWRATVCRGETSVVILSDGSAANALGPPVAGNALVVAGPDPLVALDGVGTGAFFASADAVEGPELRAAILVAGEPPWARRVFPGETVGLGFLPGGLSLPPAGLLSLAAEETAAGSATPAAEAPDGRDFSPP